MPIRTAFRDIRTINDLLAAAEREAASLGDRLPGAEHLLVAALDLTDDSARIALERTADQARDAIRASHATALARVGIEPVAPQPYPVSSGVYRSEHSAKEVFQRAKTLARSSRSGLRAAHVLVAVLERDHGLIPRVIAELKVDRDDVIRRASRAA